MITYVRSFFWLLDLTEALGRLYKTNSGLKVSKGAKIRSRYNQVAHPTQDTNGKVTNSQLDTTNESQEVSPFPAGDHKAHINRRAQRHIKHKTELFCNELYQSHDFTMIKFIDSKESLGRLLYRAILKDNLARKKSGFCFHSLWIYLRLVLI